MTHAHQVTPAVVVILPLAGLMVLIAAGAYLDIHSDPLAIVASFVFGAIALALAIRHPAALVTPVLFIPRLKEMSILSGMGPAGRWTALEVAGGLLVLAIVLRWSFAAPRGEDLPHQTDAVTSALGKSDPKVGVMVFLLFAGMVAFSYMYTASPSYGAEKLVGFLTLGGGLFFLSFVVCTSETDMQDLIIGTALFAMVVAASSLSFSATGAGGAEDNPSHIGKGQVIGLAILMLLYSNFKNRWVRAFVLWFCIPSLALGLVSSETRGPLFSLALVLGLSFFVEAMHAPPMLSRRQMAVIGAVLVSAVMVMSAYWFYGAEAEKFRYKADEITALLQGSGQARGTAVQRLGYYSAALEAWMQRPLIGWGVGGWSMIYWHLDDRRYPHNLFLEVLVEQGLVGLSILLFFLAVVFSRLRKTWAVTTRRFPWLLPCGIYLLAISMFSGDLDDDRFIWFWCGLTLSACALARRVSAEMIDTEKVSEAPGYTPVFSVVEPPFLSE